MKRIYILAIFATLISCTENVPPTCEITSPELNAVIDPAGSINVSIEAEDSNGSIREVRIFVDEIEKAVLEEPPYELELPASDYEKGPHQLKAVAVDNMRVETADEIAFEIGSAPEVMTGIAKTVGVDSAIVGIFVISGSGPMEAGIFYGTEAGTETSGTQVKFQTGPGSFSMLIRNLNPGTKYYYRAFAENELGTVYGEELSFTTLVRNVPQLTTAPVSEIEYTTATSGGSITDDGQSAITQKGVCWSTASGPTINDFLTNDGEGNSAYYSNMENLSPGTMYYIRAYAVNSSGTGYGNEVTFTTDANRIPVVRTVDVENITQTTASSGGYVVDDGGLEVIERGVCWSTSPNPTTEGDKLVSDYTGAGSYSSSITDLEPGTRYYIRAYAINSLGTAYGNEETFATLGTPVVITTPPRNIGPTTATLGGEIFSDGGMEIKRKGIYYGTTADPVNTGSQIIVSSGGYEFSANLSDLATGVIFYVVAYAANDHGTGYGEELQFVPE